MEENFSTRLCTSNELKQSGSDKQIPQHFHSANSNDKDCKHLVIDYAIAKPRRDLKKWQGLCKSFQMACIRIDNCKTHPYPLRHP